MVASRAMGDIGEPKKVIDIPEPVSVPDHVPAAEPVIEPEKVPA